MNADCRQQEENEQRRWEQGQDIPVCAECGIRPAVDETTGLCRICDEGYVAELDSYLENLYERAIDR
jgi:hypothetical protein